jgi:EAL domain-containing protein (putative c-di-GMP-specific phosphodiesterase class I)
VVSPAEFIPFAEENHLILDLGQLVLEKCLEDYITVSQRLHPKKPFTLAINVSSQEFFNHDYVEKVIEKLNDFAISPQAIELEITETYVMGNPRVAASKIQQLHDHGLKIALDDFGTGYSSLNYLKNFHIDKLKIDQSFVAEFLNDKKDMAIVKTIVNMAKIFGMQVHAEGIETKAHEEALKGLSCDVAQGYLYAKPMELESFLAYAKEHQ